ncbi:MAG: T9SS C-terminal target domain-containing protein [Calditrichaeota bacterium]|nr:T9SS type A sorting domain-containing protein [Calditrichota bacterium]RQW07419.1 MAG: T9SS C-terminal target domain-containing protein [Calditrichota bacterium]
MKYLLSVCRLTVFSLLVVLTTNLQADMILQRPVDVLNGLNNGTIQATVTPAFSMNTINNVFDGNNYTMAGVQSQDLIITLAFTDTVNFKRSKVYFWSQGVWSLETAMTESDLNSGTGSYQLLVNQRSYSAFAADSVDLGNQLALYVRFKAHDPQTTIYLGEWELGGEVALTSLYIYPRPVKVIPGTTLQLKVVALDAENNTYEYPAEIEPLVWSSSQGSVATVGEEGDLTGISLGTTTVNVRSLSGSVSGSVLAEVVNDFTSVKAPTKTVKVALVLQNPVIDSVNNRRIHQVWNWANPVTLVQEIIEDFRYASHNVIDFQIVETIDDDQIFTMIDSTFMTMDTLIYYLTPSNAKLYGRSTPGTMQYMAEIEGRIRFNYNAMVDYYDFDTKRNNGTIDEIWVYTFPFGGMYESQLMGPGAFWYNSPPLAHPGLNKLLSVMGWNYERGVAEALHSVGHRAESAIRYVYGRWEVTNPDPNPWELFTRIDMVVPGGAHIGNIHFPPNGTSDYDYANTNYVQTYADNWKRYPVLLDQTRTVNRSEWSYPGGDYQRGFMRWWFGHLPYFEGVYEGVLNNWWHYIVDYEEAVALAASTPWVGIEGASKSSLPHNFRLDQNYPNPFNPSTTFSFSLPRAENITLKIYDVLGRLVETVVDKKMTAGNHQINFNASHLASGLYFYQLNTTDFSLSRKMLLVK